MRRPADRRRLIIDAAAGLFCEHGFHNVSMADVAAAVGITAPALYRHFGNKQDLLLNAVREAVDDASARLCEAPDLDGLLRDLARRGVEQRERSLLWQREARHLPDPERDAVRLRLSDLVEGAAGLIRKERCGLSDPDSRLLAWSVLSVRSSVAWHRAVLPRRKFEDLLYLLGKRAAFGGLGSGSGRRPTAETVASTGVAVPRREQLLTEAVRLFDERGFQSVSIDEVGEAAGVSGPSLYKHFAGKTDVLVAAVVRGGQHRRAATAEALAPQASPSERIRLLLRSYIGFAMRHSHLLGLIRNELDQLPDKQRRAARQEQRDYLAMWAHALQGARPGLETAEMKITINAVLAVVDNVVRTGRLGRRADLGERLAEIGIAMLLPGQD